MNAMNAENSLLQITSDQRLSKLQKLFKKKGPVLQFILYTLLVIDGIRDGYLVDCLQIGFVDAQMMVKVICETVLIAPLTLALLPLGSDVFVIRSDRLQDRIQQLLQVNRWMAERPYTVDIDGSAPAILYDDTMEHIRSCLVETFLPFAAPIRYPTTTAELTNLMDCEPFQRSVGFPFLAGWLLGYPFVYRATGPSSALSMVPLRKVSVRVSTDKYRTAHGPSNLPTEWLNLPSDIDICEFTMPLSVLSSSVAGTDKGCTEGEEITTLGDVLTTWFSSKRRQLACMHGEVDGHCTITTEDVTLPSLVL